MFSCTAYIIGNSNTDAAFRVLKSGALKMPHPCQSAYASSGIIGWGQIRDMSPVFMIIANFENFDQAIWRQNLAFDELDLRGVLLQ